MEYSVVIPNKPRTDDIVLLYLLYYYEYSLEEFRWDLNT